jgi:hypothetical protein
MSGLGSRVSGFGWRVNSAYHRVLCVILTVQDVGVGV